MINRIKRLFQKRKDSDIELIRTFKGHKLYMFKSADNMPERRRKSYLRALRDINRNILSQDMEELANILIECVNNNDLAQVSVLAHYFKGMVSMESTTKTVIAPANCFIIIDDEPLKTFSEKHTLLKKRLIEESEEMKDFFLSVGISLTEATKDPSSVLKTLEYLKDKSNTKLESRFLQVIGSEKWMNTKQV